MVLERVTHESVGYYYCIKKSFFDQNAFDEQPDLLAKLIEDDDAARVYIFVRGLLFFRTFFISLKIAVWY